MKIVTEMIIEIVRLLEVHYVHEILFQIDLQQLVVTVMTLMFL